ncbi:serine-rich adhesin for platelets-like [Octopus sinensis]|uniref:Serine-rich adhesin for platelets-like n=1 Tax=Octopus sinensis TaxID=2607531 RepID=A0A7E6FMU6_9MOLL|nr:serine-rich adhesin for platelets-like [Octopus sinensis]
MPRYSPQERQLDSEDFVNRNNAHRNIATRLTPFWPYIFNDPTTNWIGSDDASLADSSDYHTRIKKWSCKRSLLLLFLVSLFVAVCFGALITAVVFLSNTDLDATQSTSTGRERGETYTTEVTQRSTTDQTSATTDQASTTTDQTSTTTDQTSKTSDQTTTITEQTSTTTDQTSATTDETSTTTDQTSTTTDQTSTTTDQTSTTTDQTSKTSDQTSTPTDQTSTATDQTSPTTDQTSTITDQTFTTTEQTSTTIEFSTTTSEQTSIFSTTAGITSAMILKIHFDEQYKSVYSQLNANETQEKISEIISKIAEALRNNSQLVDTYVGSTVIGFRFENLKPETLAVSVTFL